MTDEELIARACEVGAALLRRPGDLERLAGGLLAELAGRLAVRPAGYLAAAAAELAKARADNEERAGLAAEMTEMKRPAQAAEILAEVNARRMEIAAALIRIAALDRGDGPVPEERGSWPPAPV